MRRCQWRGTPQLQCVALAAALLLATALRPACAMDAQQLPDVNSLMGISDLEDPEALDLLGEQAAQRAQRNATHGSSGRALDPNAQAGAGRALLQTAAPRVAWRGRFDSKYQLGYFAPHILYITSPPAALRNVEVDPTNTPSRQPVLRVTYPMGSWSPSATTPGGTLFYAYPYGETEPIAFVGATLEYDVYFPPDFQWVKGGKLPGFGGGPHGCGGGVDPVSCWSVRVMWRASGAGEAYMYVPEGYQGADFCTQPPYTKCDYTSGVSLSRGAFTFTPGSWHRIALTVRMNDVGQANGSVEVRLNGQRMIYYDKVCYRTQPGIQVDNIYFASWFGGGDSSWATPADTYTLFKNIRMYRADPPTGRSSTVQATFLRQTIATAPPREPEF